MEKSQKIAKNFRCELCDYNTSNSYDYNKQLTACKHFGNVLAMKKSQKSQYYITSNKIVGNNRHPDDCQIGNGKIARLTFTHLRL